MLDASRRAARQQRRGGLPNAWFVVAAAEAVPHLLDGRVDALTINLPWGSLLRGVVIPEPWLVAALERLLRRGGAATMLLSVTPRDGLPAPIPAATPRHRGSDPAAAQARSRARRSSMARIVVSASMVMSSTPTIRAKSRMTSVGSPMDSAV